MASTPSERVLLDAGIFIGALLLGDPRHVEARALVEAARRGELDACTSAGILSEVYAALTSSSTPPSGVQSMCLVGESQVAIYSESWIVDRKKGYDERRTTNHE